MYEYLGNNLLQMVILASTFFLAVLLLVGYKEIRLKTLASPKVRSVSDLAVIFQKGQFLRLATLILIVVGVIDLAVLEKLSEGLVGFFSAIAGFVLGGLRDGEKVDRPPYDHRLLEPPEVGNDSEVHRE